ncbi:LacI family DNA-binding transcriptional regulator [Salinarimonas ramus]|uniref:LacI family transcriptional regulator n=1 Tax=Salinarimonas ramus TaxID=690164 RepID=A0A917Q9G7_9HYPH|nr:LacI family DNA-binding transcriptional regulator [Salinarimonas ramus]GGK37693.1 LacI family transcriptional regulator [Salinarimonas ramus]
MTKPQPNSMDVARRAGVSQSAVSRTFTPGASVSESTRAKVLAAAEELGYRPNVLARSLITGRSHIVALVVAYLDNQFYPVALEKFSKAFQALGYHVLVFMASNADEDVENVLEGLLDYQVDGVIMASVSISNRLAERCESAGVPVVLFNRRQDDERLSAVTSDNVAGGARVADHLVACGHRRIAHVSGWSGSSTGRDRRNGFVDRLAAHGIEPVAILDGMYDRDVAAAATRTLFSGEAASRPDAIFVGSDHMAFAVMDTLRFELGLRIPDDVAVVGYDDVPMAGWPAYDLTTVHQPADGMVDATVETLMARIADKTIAPRILRIDGPLVVRGSTRPHPDPTGGHSRD